MSNRKLHLNFKNGFFLFIVVNVLFVFQLSAQSLNVSGVVVDKLGEPIIGANIINKENSKIGTITDIDGKFNISIERNSTLVISSIGYKTKEVLVNNSIISIVLEDDTKALDEVVVIGYGSVKKQNLTSAVSKIDDGSIENRALTTLGDAFAGQLSGVRAQTSSGIPGSEPVIRIRGVNTINGDSSPLYVIDGVARDNMNSVNPSDVASIQILKDAAATSIYGSRGANGVVLIETKKGQGKPTVTFDGYYGFQSPNRMLDMMNGDEWVAYMSYARNEGYIRAGGSMNDPMSSRPVSNQIPVSWTDGTRPYVDWQDVITCNAPVQNYQLSASSKGELGSIYVSGGYMRQDGVIKETYYDRINFRLNSSVNLSDNIRLGMSIAPSISNQADQNTEGKESVIHHALAQSPLVQLDEATKQLGFPTDFSLVYVNPLERLKNVVDETESVKLLTSMWGEYDITKNIQFRTLYSLDYNSNKYEYFMPDLDRGSTPQGNSNVDRTLYWSIQNTLSYDKSFKDVHSLNILLGQSADKHSYYKIDASKTGYPNSLIPTLNVASTPTGASTYKDTYTTASFFGRVSYNYKEKYLLNVSLRSDGSSRFGSNNKWGIFPSTSVAWKINRENFLDDLSWLTLLKVRTSWGQAGNDRIGNYDYMSLLNIKNTVWNNKIVSGYVPANIANENLKWETTTTLDFGLDISLFNNRIQLNLDYYKNKTTDLLFNKPIPSTTGFGSIRTNIGSIQNTGWEIDLNTFNIKTKNFSWNTSLNLSRNRNKVLDMGGDDEIISQNWDAQFITKVGAPVCQYYVYRTDGVLTAKDFDSAGNAIVPIIPGQVEGNQKYVDQDNNGVINSLDLVPYGNPLPDLMYGLTNTFAYKGFELRVLLQGQFGGDVCWLGSRQLDEGSWVVTNLSHWVNCYKPDYMAKYGENPIPEVKGVDMSWDGKTPYVLSGKFEKNSDYRIYDATFLKIKNITLSYTLPQKVLKNVYLNNAKIYISIDDLAQFDKYPGITPEANNYGNQTTQQGVDYTTYPLSKRFIIGASLTF